MYYNKLIYSRINELILENDFIIEEFLIEELSSEKMLDLFDINTSSDVISISIRSIYDEEVYLVIYESYYEDDYGEPDGDGLFIVQSPGEVREIEYQDKKGNLSISELVIIVKKWLENLSTIGNIKNIDFDQEILSNFEEYSKKIDKEFDKDDTFSNIELTEINAKVDEIKKKYEDSIKTMMEKEKENSEKFKELKKELTLVKKEFSRWKTDAKVMTKRKWFKKLPMSLLKVTRKVPNTVMFLTTALSLGEADSKNMLLGTGLAFISDLTKSEVTSSDIIEQQKNNAPS